MKKNTNMINHIPIKQVCWKENIILIKDAQIWVDQKKLKKPNEKKCYYQRTKVRKLGSLKMKGLKKPS
jgi:hypothetical protein